MSVGGGGRVMVYSLRAGSLEYDVRMYCRVIYGSIVEYFLPTASGFYRKRAELK